MTDFIDQHASDCRTAAEVAYMEIDSRRNIDEQSGLNMQLVQRVESHHRLGISKVLGVVASATIITGTAIVGGELIATWLDDSLNTQADSAVLGVGVILAAAGTVIKAAVQRTH